MKRLVLAVLTLLLVLTACLPAAAVTMSDEDKERMYQDSIDSLIWYLESSEEGEIDLRERHAELTTELKNYRKSNQLAYYMQILIWIEEDNFDLVFMTLELLATSEEFVEWLGENERLGTLAQLECYASARRAELQGKYVEAVEEYKQCSDFFDAFPRLMSLMMGTEFNLEKKYNEAWAAYESRNYKKALELMRELAEYNYGDSVAMVVMLENLTATPAPATPAPTATPTPSPTPVPPLSFIGPRYIETQYYEGAHGQECLTAELWNMLDDDIQTSYYWLVWTSDYLDSKPEFTFHFDNDAIAEIHIRNGRLTSSHAYSSYKRMKKLVVRIYCAGMPVQEEIIELKDAYSKEYQVFPLRRTYTNVQRIEFFYKEGCNGKGSNVHRCHITDVKFIGYD